MSGLDSVEHTRMDSGSSGGRFFRRIDWMSFWTGTVLAFIVYFITAASTVTLEDSGELAVAGDHLGVPHPPGYPIWTMCAWVFARVFRFVTFRGQPNPAWAIGIMSGFFGALAAGLTAMLVTRTSWDVLQTQRPPHDDDDDDIDDGCGDAREGWLGRVVRTDTLCWVAGVAASLVFAFSPVMWSQATIVEVYTLNAFFLMLIFVMTYRWMNRPTNRLLWMTAFVFGLGLTNYQVLLLAIIPLVIVIMLQNISLFRDFMLVVIPFVLTAGVMKLGAMPSQPGFPKHVRIPSDDITRSLVVDPEYYVVALLLLAVFVVAAAIAGVKAMDLAKAGRRIAVNKGPLHVAAGVCGLAGLALIVFCARIPAAPVPEAFLSVPPEHLFGWGLPLLALLVGLAGLFVLAAFTPAGFWYAVAMAGIQIALAIFIRKGALLGLTHPLSATFAFYVSLNFVVLGLAWLLLPFGRTVSLTVLAAELGVAFYGYMPLSSETNPPMNWGYPRTWEGFKHALTRGQYEKIAPQTMFSPLFMQQVGAYFADMRTQFTLMLAPFGFVPFAVWCVRIRRHRVHAVRWAVWIAAAVAVVVAVEKVAGVGGLERFRFDKLLVAVVLMLAFVGVHAIVISQLAAFGRHAVDQAETPSSRLVSGLSCGLCVLFIAGVALGFCNAAAETVLEVFGVFEPPATASQAAHHAYWLKDVALTAVVYACWLGIVGLLSWLIITRNRCFSIEIGSVTQRWQIATLACFLVMSVGLIALANPRYDIQDNFIQKVKFISSHGIFAVWIGSGFAYAMVVVRRFRLVGAGLVGAIFLTPLILIHENYFNDRLVDTLSAADQTGHDFGWQFGNYQLRGAAAIAEELDPEEEPLPNPDFPPAMTPNAIFFGGTDPGRFVPTYMIYSANVRPDVFLITQNALADNTYMDTMRNLYADDIWMPTMDDNAAAFQTYVDDVQAGRRPNIGGIQIEGGRVQVTGALAVMEINGILTEKIFHMNRDRHDFYVEESYAIRWMYPYLTPHGLIMKLNDAPIGYTADVAANDLDFWDWYTRRLLANPRYPRDFAARKSFSKLRSAIAGTYTQRRMLKEAERAYQEARALYVYSPEANLRLIQEVLLPQRRMDESVDLLRLLKRLDPNNTRIPLDELLALQAADRRHAALSARIQAGETLGEPELIDLMQSGFVIGLPQAGLREIATHIAANGMTPWLAFRAGMILADHGRNDEASQFLSAVRAAVLAELDEASPAKLRRVYEIHGAARNQTAMLDAVLTYLRHAQNDWQAWLDCASLLLATGESARARQAMANAVRFGGREAETVISQVEHLRRLHQSAGPSLPGPSGPNRQPGGKP